MNAEARQDTLRRETQAGLERGWRYVLLDGKKPKRRCWQNKPATWAEIEAHISNGGNVGVITGVRSGGLVVLDFDGDQGRAFFEEHPDLAQTVVAQTGHGLHAYFHHDGPLGNSSGTLPAGVDVRGNGGQVVAVGSVHPETRHAYAWLPGQAPGEVGIAPLPPWVVSMLPTGKDSAEHVPPPESHLTRTEGTVSQTRRAKTALAHARKAIAETPEGERNNRLNEAAYTMGGYVASGEIGEVSVRAAILEAARRAGLDESEAHKTIQSGLTAGREHPFQPGKESLHDGALAIYYRFMDEWHGFLLPSVAGCWQVLFRHADKTTNTVELSASKIAALMGASKRTADRALAMLRDHDLLVIIRQGGPENGANIYRLTMPAQAVETGGGSVTDVTTSAVHPQDMMVSPVSLDSVTDVTH